MFLKRRPKKRKTFLTLSNQLQGGRIQSMFPAEDEVILRQAANLAQEAKSSHQYTDIQKFTLKCMICDVKLSGSEAAQKHAKETGHQSFGEVVA